MHAVVPRRSPLLALAASLVLATASPAAADEGGISLFVRGDSDETLVVAPRVAAQGVLNEERTSVNAAYSADIWTSASIDIRTAATMAVTEQRDQVDLSANHQFDDVTLGGSYYYSGENDYWSHGFTLRSTQELDNNSTTFEESVRYIHDVVGRAGDPYFERPLDTVGLRAVLTQILSPDAIVQAAWEGMYRTGYQASPYRFVGLGGDGICGMNPDTQTRGSAELCIPESHPTTRIRNAFVLRGRYAFSRDSSAGIGYRFYFDDWGVLSHTAVAQIAWVPEPGQTVTLRYRFYTQTEASFYESTYPSPGPSGQVRFATRDRELSPMFSNRLAIAYQGRARLGRGATLQVAIAIGGSAFVYSDFVGLDEVYSLDGTVAVSLEL